MVPSAGLPHAATGSPGLAARVAVAGLLLAGPAPMLVQLGRSLWDREQYQFFPLMILGAAAVAWERWQDRPARLASLRRGSAVVAGGLLVVALAVLVTSTLLWVRSLSLVATLFLLAGIVWRIGSWSLLRLAAPSLVLLAICVPPPSHQDQAVTLRLQHLAVTVSGRLLDALGVANFQQGNVIDLPGRRLLIEQACSGINSLMAVLAFTLLYGFYLRRSAGRIALLLPAAVLFVVGGNVVRITSEAWLCVRHHIDLTEGFAHQMLGLVLFAGCVGLVASWDALLGGTGDLPHSPVAAPSSASPFSVPVGRPAWVLAAVFAAAGGWTGARVWHAWRPPALSESATFDLPPSVAGWDQVKSAGTVVERPQTEASKSTIWQFRRGDTFASVALDYPFTGYHELVTCYSVSGWNVTAEVADPTAGLTQVTMHKATGHGHLLFAQVDEQGRPVMAPAYTVDRTASWSGRLHNDLAYARRMAMSGPSYQVQVLVQTAGEPTVDQRRAAEDLFRAARDTLAAELLSQMGGHS